METMNKRLLVAGPDFGMEFGWLLMAWQARIRAMSRQYDQTVVITSDAMYPIYADFAVRTPTIGTRDRFRFSDVDVDYVKPSKEVCKGNAPEVFRKYGGCEKTGKQQIVIHARSDQRKVKGNRNWPEKNWNELIEKLFYACDDPCFFAIGTQSDAICPKHSQAVDCRGAGLRSIMALLSASHVCIGPSSGPMHLASLCGCPHVVWTDSKVWDLSRQKGTNRQRYESVWNPFGTPVKVVDSHGWQPPVEPIFQAVKEMI
jgi:hypothetical protein